MTYTTSVRQRRRLRTFRTRRSIRLHPIHYRTHQSAHPNRNNKTDSGSDNMLRLEGNSGVRKNRIKTIIVNRNWRGGRAFAIALIGMIFSGACAHHCIRTGDQSRKMVPCRKKGTISSRIILDQRASVKTPSRPSPTSSSSFFLRFLLQQARHRCFSFSHR